MRPSNRDKILDAAVRVVLREGLTGLTFDAVAAEAGVTRGGMMYHFPARDALIQAIHEYLARQWDADMTSTLGKPLAQTSADERLTAYTYASAQSVSRAELVFFLDSIKDPQLVHAWESVLERWTVPAPENADDPAELRRFIARLAADGLWVYESMWSKQLPEDFRLRVAAQITRLFIEASGDDTNEA